MNRTRLLAVGLLLAAATAGGAVLLRDDGDRVSAGPARTTASAAPDTSAAPTGQTTPTTPTAATAAASSSSSTAAPTTTTTIDPRLGSGRPVLLAFGGDVHFESFLRPQLDANPDAMLAPISPLLSAADLAVVNLETAITERGSPVPKAYNFRAPATAFRALAGAGVDVATMANNHGLDYGSEGFADSLASARGQGFPVIGIGTNATEAYAPYRTVVSGQRIAVLAATQVLDDSLISSWTATDTQPGLASAKEVERLTQAVRDARATSDTVVVFLHWGTEGQSCPQERQATLARQLVDAGADVVVGGHAHRLQGAGRLDDALVAYGLGNFVFYKQSGPGTETGVLYVTVTGRRVDSYGWMPARIRNGVPHPLEGDDAAAARAAWEQLRGCTGLAA